MKLTLETAAEYVRTGKTAKAFYLFIQQIRRIFTFTQERANRLTRFIAIVKAYKNGRLVNDIEAEYGCSRNTVLRYARMAGLPKRPKTDDPTRHDRIIALSKKGVSAAEIAKACNCSIALVSKIERRAGLGRYKNKSK